MNIYNGSRKGKVVETKRKYCSYCKKIHNFYIVQWEHGKTTENCPNQMVPCHGGMKMTKFADSNISEFFKKLYSEE